MTDQPAPMGDDTRQVIHAIRDQMQTLRLTLELQNRRIEDLEKMMSEHNTACLQNKNDLNELLDLVKTIKQGMRVTNFMRNVFVWFAGLISAAAALWHTIHKG